MKTAFADASFYVALLITRDINHVKAKEIAGAWTGSIVTTEFVLTEVANYLSGTPAHRNAFGQFLESIQTDQNTCVVESTHDLWERGIIYYLHRLDKRWSHTDCVSFLVMEERSLTHAFTADHHFEQAGFTAMLNA